MGMIVWAFGAMLVLMLIIAFLPIGFTLRGKIYLVLASFILALGGLGAVTSFPLWQSALMIFLLILVTAYIMNSRLAAVFYSQEIDSMEDDYKDESPESFDIVKQPENSTDLDMIDLGEIEITAPSTEKIENIYEDSHELQPQMLEENDELADIEVEEVSFLDEQPEIQLVETSKDIEPEEGYLADIESLLLEETIVPTTFQEDDLPEEINKDKSKEENILFDDENDLEELFFAMKETAATIEEDHEKSRSKKTVQLQK
ncbi:hypothetical protein PH210_20175 [Paenibacillus sp. BSR1-1]|uniref:hypothetical protein n=1 Tax=Paenibacillus sp. BSR1-1 TaxID=3020845 RepID=UPI0025AEEB6B|nr:hypothetical protein [Paenibacillus sp. BSR1-1]MDN3018504.1 hypothetical protein [Paenibacillus sp. BSR1-1]